MFDFEKFDELESFDEKIKYADDELLLIGTGNTRFVYALDDSRVLKVARNEEGIFSNNIEKHYSEVRERQ